MNWTVFSNDKLPTANQNMEKKFASLQHIVELPARMATNASEDAGKKNLQTLEKENEATRYYVNDRKIYPKIKNRTTLRTIYSTPGYINEKKKN